MRETRSKNDLPADVQADMEKTEKENTAKTTLAGLPKDSTVAAIRKEVTEIRIILNAD